MKPVFALLCAALAIGAPARAGQITEFASTHGGAENVLVIDSVTDLDAIQPLIAAFQRRNPEVTVRYNDLHTSELYEIMQTACDGGTEIADLVISSGIDQQIKHVNDGCAQPHRSTYVDALPAWARWRNEVFGLTFEPAAMVYNKKLIPPEEVPETRFDLIDLLRAKTEMFRGRIATYDIQQSGVGYLFAFMDSRQASTFGRLIESFGRSDVVLLCCTGVILDGVSEGRFLFGYNVLGSYAIARAKADPNIGIILPKDYTLVLTRAAFIPRLARRPHLAKQFLDFALSPDGHRVLSNEAYLFSAQDGGAALRRSELFSESDQHLRPIALSPALIVGLDKQERANFIGEWRKSVGTEASGSE